MRPNKMQMVLELGKQNARKQFARRCGATTQEHIYEWFLLGWASCCTNCPTQLISIF
jgi:hypothetical protein